MRLAAEVRAIVYLTVDWSGPERHSRQVFQEAMNRLGETRQDIAFGVVGEECDGYDAWLGARNVPKNLGCSGSGPVIWLESGRVIAWEVNAAWTGADRIVDRTRFLWPPTSP